MTYLSRQEAFTKAYKGLESQGFQPAVTYRYGVFFCSYRGDEGRRCAYGWLIPDHLEDEIEEGIEADSYDDGFYQSCGLNPEDRRFFLDLQGCHDNAYKDGRNPIYPKEAHELMKEYLAKFAEKYGLQIPA